MGDLAEPDSEVSHGKFPKYLRREDEHLNSESIEKKSGQSDVYDSTSAIPPIKIGPQARGRQVRIMLEKVKVHVGNAKAGGTRRNVLKTPAAVIIIKPREVQKMRG